MARHRSGRRQDSTDDARSPESGRPTARRGASGRGPADSYEDRSLYDQCITRGLPGSMMPAIYGNSYQIHQAPGYVAIRYEMIHETRIIPLDGRAARRLEDPHLHGRRARPLGRQHAGRRDHQFQRRRRTAAPSEKLQLDRAFKPSAPNKVEWSVTFDDAATWARPWTFAMNLTKDATQPPFEYACHEGNYGLANILSAARAEEKTGK